jgi:hypothetical protein
MKQKIFSCLIIFALVTGASAQKQRVDKNAPDASRLRAAVTYLASDKLDGRRTGTDGARAAASYIAKEFARLGLKPGGVAKADGKSRPGYMQSFPYVAGVELGKTNAVSLTRRAPAVEGESLGGGITTLDLRLNDDWMPLGFSSNSRLYTLPLTFVGYGITAGDLNYDDYAGAEVKDRVALVLEGTPDADNPHGEFARYTDVRWKAVAARDHGAQALVIIAGEDNFRDDRLSKLSYDNSAGDAGLPVIVISRQAAAQVLGLGGIPQLAELEKRVAGAAAARRSATAVGAGATYPIMDAVNKASFLEQSRLTIGVSIVRKDAPADNVIGILEGSDAKLKKEFIVIGAHYDHLGRGGEGSLAPREGEVHHGADDNASGVAGVLELARNFSTAKPKPKRTLVFIAFSGEEEGLLGSNFYVNHPVVPLAQTVAMINMDMIGRLKDDKLIVGGVGTAQGFSDLVKLVNAPKIGSARTPAAMTGIPQLALTLNEDGYGPSDHSSFYAKQVPVLFFWTGTHEDYHKPSDTADKINYEGEARIISLIANVVNEIDRNDNRPAYTVAKSEASGRTMSFKVSLGTIPNYAESNDGLKLDGVREDSPAAKAGIKGGDVIVRLAGRDVHNVYDYTYALGEMKAGVEYEVELMRGGERLKLKVIPAARK